MTGAAPSLLGMSPSTVSGLSNGLSGAGVALQTVGAFYSAEADRYNLKSQASTQDFQASLAAFNARSAELDAQRQLRASQQEAGRSDLRYRQILARSRVAQNRGGIQAGVGSAGEVQASIRFSQQSDRFSITMNGVLASNAARLRSVGLQNQALLARTSAANLRRQARGISPALAALTSAISGGASLLGQQAQQQRAGL